MQGQGQGQGQGPSLQGPGQGQRLHFYSLQGLVRTLLSTAYKYLQLNLQSCNQ